MENTSDTIAPTLEGKLSLFQEELNQLLEKYGLLMGAGIDFPLYKQVPVEVELALKVIEKHEVAYKIIFQEKKEEK